MVAEVLFPNTIPPFFPSFVLFAPPPSPEDYAHRRAGHPGPQPLAGRLRRRVPGAAGRHRPDLPQRHRRRHRGRALDQGARPAGRRPDPQHPAGREVDQAPAPPRLRPAVGGLPGARRAGQQPRRHRLAGVRQDPVVGGAHDRRGPVLLAAPVRAAAPRRRLRALPPAEVRDDRDGLRLDPAAAAPSRLPPGRHPQERRHRRAAVRRGHGPAAVGRPSTSTATAGSASASPSPEDAAARDKIGPDRFMWGSDYPHDEGTYPFTREHLRQLFHGTPEAGDAGHPGRQRRQAVRLRPVGPGADRGQSSGRPSTRSPLRWTRLPDHPNEALLKAVAS